MHQRMHQVPSAALLASAASDASKLPNAVLVLSLTGARKSQLDAELVVLHDTPYKIQDSM
jgi:hypothetical protein